ncbi:MAG: helix-turn-helix domain-containing protein [Sphingobacterium sp.]|jgi:transcriptional regulator with XRE-family HTH domain|uniref:helix-turn-helix domain-containing protein n=1 Tax=Sphingobacterium sp. TaxID=341027 RepID=UPI002840ED1F|nr:helix-turn-helix transcriptional regulator [Sphingobacterium sp.]MDR3010861.1 helix-turn-helix domain-containing protein [Sphingobacterium sp.]
MKLSRRKANQEKSGLLEVNVIDQWLEKHGDPAIERLVKKNLAISDKISQILASKGMKASDLATLMNKQKSEISKWLSGQHTFTTKTIVAIEAALDTEIIFVEPIHKNIYFTVHSRIPSNDFAQDEVFEESVSIGEYVSA